MQHANGAVVQVRAEENRELRAKGDQQLSSTETLFRYAQENLPARYQERFEALKQAELKTGKAYALKESLRALWACPDEATGKQHLSMWLQWVHRSGLAPIKNLAQLVAAHAQGILNYFGHRITSATCEGLNNAIATLTATSGISVPPCYSTSAASTSTQVLPATHAIGR